MAVELTKQEKKDAVGSLQRYLAQELETELNEMQAGFLLEYILKEIAPFAYNQGVREAERLLRERMEDLSGSCYEEPMAYWRLKKKRS